MINIRKQISVPGYDLKQDIIDHENYFKALKKESDECQIIMANLYSQLMTINKLKNI